MTRRVVAGEGTAGAAALGGPALAALELLNGVSEPLLGLKKSALRVGAVVEEGRRGGRERVHLGGGRRQGSGLDGNCPTLEFFFISPED